MGTNTIRWSHTRSTSLAKCPRAFWYGYYAWGEEIQRWTELVSPLLTHDMLAGQVVDAMVNVTLMRARTNKEQPEDLAELGVQEFRKALKLSAIDGEYMRRELKLPDHPVQVLHCDFYREVADKGTVERCEGKIRKCLVNWVESEVWERIQTIHPSKWMTQKAAQQGKIVTRWQVEGLLVASAFDFWFKDDDKIYIFEWKSGFPAEDAQAVSRQQLASYALWAVAVKGYEPENVFGQSVFLQLPVHWNPMTFTQDELYAAQMRLATDKARELEFALPTGKTDQYGREQFAASMNDCPPKPEVGRCRDCKYRGLCNEGKELVRPYVEKRCPAIILG